MFSERTASVLGLHHTADCLIPVRGPVPNPNIIIIIIIIIPSLSSSRPSSAPATSSRSSRLHHHHTSSSSSTVSAAADHHLHRPRAQLKIITSAPPPPPPPHTIIIIIIIIIPSLSSSRPSFAPATSSRSSRLHHTSATACHKTHAWFTHVSRSSSRVWCRAGASVCACVRVCVSYCRSAGEW